MPKNSVLGRPTHISHLPKRGFNMSEDFKFTSSTGQLLPVMFDFLNPSERIKVNFDLFTRTMPVSTAAMVDIDEFVDLFFVPLQKIYSPAGLILQNIDDFHSSVFTEGAQYNPVQTGYADNIEQVIPSMDSSIFWTDSQYLPADDANSVYGHDFDKFWSGTYRLFDHLGLNPAWCCKKAVLDTFQQYEDYAPLFNPMFLLAYQAIYFDYYRLSSWESNKTYAYNCDTLASQLDPYFIGQGVYNNVSRLKSVLELRYRPYARDYFKALEPSPLVGPVGILDKSTSIDPQNYVAPHAAYLINSNGQPDFNNSSTLGYTPGGTSNISYAGLNRSLNVQSIRSMFAINKLLQITGRAGKHYDDQILAHYGFKVPKGISNEVYFLGGHHQQLHIGEVISTASTNEAPLGEIAGKGYSKGNSKDITFVAPCHGILMAIYSCVPRPSYITGLNKLHTMLTRYQFYHPELDNLGYQPLFAYETWATTANASIRVGWQPRYMQLKVKYPRATRAFDNSFYGGDPLNKGTFRDWAITYHGNRSNAFDGLDEFLCSPYDLDQIMLQSYDGFVERTDLENGYPCYDTDPLIHSLKTSYFKTSPMSTFGIDELKEL